VNTTWRTASSVAVAEASGCAGSRAASATTHRPSPSSAADGTGNAATHPGRTLGEAPSTASSMSCGYRFRPRMMIMSLSRPAMNSSPS
jgi:hypothetical protein